VKQSLLHIKSDGLVDGGIAGLALSPGEEGYGDAYSHDDGFFCRVVALGPVGVGGVEHAVGLGVALERLDGLVVGVGTIFFMG